MIELFEITYITEKEASFRYGYSVSWFKKRRTDKLKPMYIKMEGKGKVYYPLIDTDNWFKDNMISSEDL